jgi:hypothetical protein
MWTLLMSVAMAEPDPAAVNEVIDELHRAAADADSETYFGLFSDDAVFVGTDRTERWTMSEFRAFAEPHFAEAPAWVYESVRRELSFDARGKVAWFDEDLRHAKYGEVRGSGVLVRQGKDWRVAQYVLSFPIPNEVAGDVVAQVIGFGGDKLPTPFTADEIRAAWRPGTQIVFRIRDGEATTRQRWTVTGADDSGGTTRFDTLDGDGEVLGASSEAGSTWAELRDHAAFERASTVHTTEMLDSPLGPLHCQRFDVSGADERISRFWFSPAHPGPPVLMQVVVGDAVVYEMAQVAREHVP